MVRFIARRNSRCFKLAPSAPESRRGQDPHFAATIEADPNLIAFKCGIPLKAGNDIIGAIGVSSAQPGGHDERNDRNREDQGSAQVTNYIPDGERWL
jgi:uncharacterized protein GlcG (DUF336 family)